MKYLIVKTSALGDIFQSLPALDYLRKKAPFAQIDWIAEKEICPLLEKHPAIDHVIPINTKSWKRGNCLEEIRGVKQRLQKTHYDAVFDLQGNFKSMCVRFFTRSHVKIGWDLKGLPEKCARLGLSKVFPRNTQENMRHQYLHLISQFFWEPLASLPKSTSFAISPNEKKRGEILLVCMGSKWSSKKISVDIWVEALKGVNADLLFVAGCSKEEEEAKKAISLLGKGALHPKSSLVELYACVQSAKLVCAVDSMPLHMAAYASVPTVSVFGPSRKEIYAPLGSKHQVLGLPCSGLKDTQKRCSHLRKCGVSSCIRISPKELSKAIQKGLVS